MAAPQPGELGSGYRLKRWKVTVTHTLEVIARDEEAAEFLAQEKLDFYGAATTDTQVEELDEFGLTEERGPED